MEGYPVRWFGSWAIVALPAEVDISNAERLRDQLLLVIDDGAADVVADMSAATFCDSSGVHALIRAHKHAASQGGKLHVVTGSPAVLRVFDLLGVGKVISIFPTVAAAMAAGTTFAPDADVLPERAGPAGPAAAGAGSPGDGIE
jgi:anti-sigma B factor antagonist